MFLGITPVSSVSNGLYFLTLPLVSVMRVIYWKIRHVRYLYIKRNVEKVWGARYTLGARYLSKNTVLTCNMPITCTLNITMNNSHNCNQSWTWFFYRLYLETTWMRSVLILSVGSVARNGKCLFWRLNHLMPSSLFSTTCSWKLMAGKIIKCTWKQIWSATAVI